jgi:hypothetical protein
MYRSCIFCSGDLGSNEALEEFPVGRSLAFDAWKGRLWAVCPRCCRWNLAPLEERWEAVESAEKRFRDSRLRVQSENVGLCRLPDGTRLVRVGQALPGELAAWRYGSTLVGRRRQYLLMTGVVAAGALVVVGGMWAAGALGGVNLILQPARLLYERRQGEKVVARLSAGDSTRGEAFTLRRRHLTGARLVLDASGNPAMLLPRRQGRGALREPFPEVVVQREAARPILSRGMVVSNSRGARARDVDDALALLAQAGTADEMVRKLACAGMGLGIRGSLNARTKAEAVAMPRVDRLALEMALHEQQERTAMEGELAGLEAAWREAEEIARIADALPGEPRETGRP